MDLCIKLEQKSKHSWNIYKQSINIWLQWLWTLTLDLQNLSRSSLSPSGPLYQIWRNSLKAFPRYYVLKHGPDKCDVTVTLTFDLWPPKSNQFILETVNTCAKFGENPSKHSWDIAINFTSGYHKPHFDYRELSCMSLLFPLGYYRYLQHHFSWSELHLKISVIAFWWGRMKVTDISNWRSIKIHFKSITR